MTRRTSVSKPKAQPKPSHPIEPVIRLKPRRGLFIVLLAVFVIWIAFLLTLYFTTVYHKTDVHEEKAPAQVNPG